MLSVGGTLLAALPIFAIWRVQLYYSAIKQVENAPGMRVLFSPLSLLGAVIPTTWWNPGLRWCWAWRTSNYMRHTHEIISTVPMILGSPAFYVGSLGAMKRLLEDESRIAMEKPRELISALLLWGDNLIAVSGEAWKRHRRVVAPAFTQTTYRLVVSETASLYQEMVETEGWQDTQIVDDINTVTMKFALTIIGRCGFGLPMPWKEDLHHVTMQFPEALSIVSETVIMRLILPSWVYRLPIKSLRRMDEAWRTTRVFMDSLIDRQKMEMSTSGYDSEAQKGDIFTKLVEAHVNAGKLRLNRDELMGNTFALMFAGHETTARTLAGTLAYLAIHQEEQNMAVTEICIVLQDRCDMTLEDIPKFKHVLACFYEALRIFPAGVTLARNILQGYSFPVSRPVATTIKVRPNTSVVVDMIGVHHDPHVFPNPESYQPSRWYDTPDHDVSMFGLGPRACIGRKFAQTEAICFLALFLRDWKVDIVLVDGESRQEFEQRVMSKVCNPSLGFGVGPVTLQVTRRQRTGSAPS